MAMDLGLSQATASAFLEAFRRCELGANDSKYFMAFPALVCAAFSAEVGLKTILKREGISAHGHDLLSLFMQLSGEKKIEIADETGISIEDFAAHLNHSKKAFVEWRYIYEEPGEKMISLLFIGKFAAAVEAAGLRMKNAV